MGCPELCFISARMFEGIVQTCSLLTFLRTEDACLSCPWVGETLPKSSVVGVGVWWLHHPQICGPDAAQEGALGVHPSLD